MKNRNVLEYWREYQKGLKDFLAINIETLPNDKKLGIICEIFRVGNVISAMTLTGGHTFKSKLNKRNTITDYTDIRCSTQS